jgi:hypothetical protein
MGSRAQAFLSKLGVGGGGIPQAAQKLRRLRTEGNESTSVSSGPHPRPGPLGFTSRTEAQR